MKLPRRIKLDIDQEYYNLIPAQQGDTARVLNFQILNNNIPFSLENKTVRARIKKPDGNVCYNDMEIINASEGECDLKLTNQILIKPGMCKVQLEIMENGEILSTIIFAIFIRESIDIKDAAESTNEFTALENGIIKLDEWDKYFKETSGAIEEKYTERLNEIDSSLEDIATNLTLEPIQVPENDNDWAKRLQRIIDRLYDVGGGKVLIPSGEYGIGSTVDIKPNVIIIGSGNSTIIKPLNNITMFNLHKNGQILDLKFDLVEFENENVFDKNVIELNGENFRIYGRGTDHNTQINNIGLFANRGISNATAIKFISDARANGFGFVKINNINIRGFKYGIHLLNSNDGWINSNIFTNITGDQSRMNLIRLEGGCNSNFFTNIQHQHSSVDEETSIYIDGISNVFNNIFIYDSPNGQQRFNLTPNSKNNIIIGYAPINAFKDKDGICSDDVINNNIIIDLKGEVLSIPFTNTFGKPLDLFNNQSYESMGINNGFSHWLNDKPVSYITNLDTIENINGICRLKGKNGNALHLRQELNNIKNSNGKKVTLYAKVKANSTNQGVSPSIRIVHSESIGLYSDSIVIPKDDEWHLLKVTATLSQNNSQLAVYFYSSIGTCYEGDIVDIDWWTLTIGTSSIEYKGHDEYVSAPSTSTSQGIPGQKSFDNSYFYVCTAKNTWKRFLLNSW